LLTIEKIVYPWWSNALRCRKKVEYKWEHLCDGRIGLGEISLEAPYIKEDISGESRDAYTVSCSSIPKMRIEKTKKIVFSLTQR
jgi:hypothetical protein